MVIVVRSEFGSKRDIGPLHRLQGRTGNGKSVQFKLRGCYLRLLHPQARHLRRG